MPRLAGSQSHPEVERLAGSEVGHDAAVLPTTIDLQPPNQPTGSLVTGLSLTRTLPGTSALAWAEWNSTMLALHTWARIGLRGEDRADSTAFASPRHRHKPCPSGVLGVGFSAGKDLHEGLLHLHRALHS
mmetsp:Transcript_20373/g.59505  ORF Transcript_20373/g.59505 Transcript_20373/m.59505 type:complete len:130 (-) Transcript_20373:210-599(-)